jgi:uncharacterized membrane protein (DUF4010 family)
MARIPVVLKLRLLSRANFSGGALVNVLAFVVQPAVYLKRMSIVRGARGSSIGWKVVAVAMHSPATFKRIFGKHPEPLGSWSVASNSFVNVVNAKPMSKKQRKQAGISKKAMREAIIARAVADTRAANPDAKIVVKTK